MKPLKPLVSYQAAPWDTPFAQRYAVLLQGIREQKKIAVHAYQGFDYGTFRYRCYNIMQALQKSKTWACVYFTQDELPQLHAVISHFDLFFAVRMRWSVPLSNFLLSLREVKCKTIYDTDDMIFDLAQLPVFCNTLNLLSEQTYDFWFAYLARNRQTALLCDACCTTNAYLQTVLQRTFPVPCVVVENFANEEQLAVSALLRAEKETTRCTSRFEIGYFSGSGSHMNDLKCVYRELMAMMERHDNVYFHVVGFMEFPADMQELVHAKRVVLHPLVDFIELQRLMAQVDVCIAPLLENEFTQCKSALKYFEAALVDTPIIATPTFAFRQAIRHGENGFLCRPGEWLDTLETIYQTMPDVAKTARQDCLAYYTPTAQRPLIEVAYDTLLRV